MRFRFPHGLACASDVLGSRTKVVMPGVVAQICMPVGPASDVDTLSTRFTPPPVRGIKRLVRHAEIELGEEERLDWGSFYMLSAKYGWIAMVRNMVLRVQVDDASDSGLVDASERVNAEIYRWYLLLRDWLEVLAHVDLDHESGMPHSGGRSPIETPSWVADLRQEGSTGHIFDRHPGTAIGGYGGHVTRTQWLHAVTMANRGLVPPEPHLLLRDARNAHRRQLARRCVLDCATAVEIAVSQYLEERLDEDLGHDARKKLMPGRVTQRIGVLRALGRSISSDVESAIFHVRNRVIHGGYRPDMRESRAALTVATRTIVDYSPLRHVNPLTPGDDGSPIRQVFSGGRMVVRDTGVFLN